MDLMGPYPTSYPGNFKWLLVVVDKFTKWIELFPLKDAEAPQIVKCLEDQVFTRFGVPETMTSDNGRNLIGDVLQSMYKRWGIKQILTSTYHPQSNFTERINRNLKPMIGTFITTKAHRSWANHIPMFALALRTCVSETTGCTPSKLMFNREMRLPLDNFLNVDVNNPNEIVTHPDNDNNEKSNPLMKCNDDLSQALDVPHPDGGHPSVSSDVPVDSDELVDQDILDVNLSNYLKILEFVRERTTSAQKQQKKYYDARHRDIDFGPGDLVLVMTHFLSKKEKYFTKGFAPKYEGPFRILRMLSPVNVEVESLDGTMLMGRFHVSQLRKYYLRDPPHFVLDDEPPNETTADAPQPTTSDIPLNCPPPQSTSDAEPQDEIISDVPLPIVQEPNETQDNTIIVPLPNSSCPQRSRRNLPRVDYRKLHMGKGKVLKS